MPENFSKLDLEDPSSVEFVLEALRKHALSLVQPQLQKAGQKPTPENLATMAFVIDRWLKGGEEALSSNILYSGLTPHEYLKQASALEPFDDQLSVRLQELAEKTDGITRQLNEERRGLPEERASLLRRQAEAMQAIQLLRVQEGDDIVEAYRNQESADIEELQQGFPTIERSDEVASALRQSIADIDALQVSLLERASSSKERVRLVKRLRTMSP